MANQNEPPSMRTTTNRPQPPADAATPPPPARSRERGATHLMVRTRKTASFRRAGLAFTAEFRPLKRSDLGEGVEATLKAEPMLEVIDANERDIERHADIAAHSAPADARSSLELRAALFASEKRCEALEKELDDLHARIRDGLTQEPVGAPKLT